MYIVQLAQITFVLQKGFSFHVKIVPPTKTRYERLAQPRSRWKPTRAFREICSSRNVQKSCWRALCGRKGRVNESNVWRSNAQNTNLHKVAIVSQQISSGERLARAIIFSKEIGPFWGLQFHSDTALFYLFPSISMDRDSTTVFPFSEGFLFCDHGLYWDQSIWQFNQSINIGDAIKPKVCFILNMQRKWWYESNCRYDTKN